MDKVKIGAMTAASVVLLPNEDLIPWHQAIGDGETLVEMREDGVHITEDYLNNKDFKSQNYREFPTKLKSDNLKEIGERKLKENPNYNAININGKNCRGLVDEIKQEIRCGGDKEKIKEDNLKELERLALFHKLLTD
ncbi:hypothetical protein EIN_149160 [Entamoeba invadens IP1]|uniref:Uncharacterized protein n=1 Tax=Entamoeba invadens IP1 TaxID=370355 RepID=L7FK63_ENTIV|nr:hypothetical protein EIN_149160 [Entamoeba invadens IP1]ELP85544.1 hypothetical protein EIN_149160 [Entamoeba invadens IP1]|eukprot:XP_004184890.1 hypothetical protein EIN_149160 [Entamoeba invadens IP1]